MSILSMMPNVEVLSLSVNHIPSLRDFRHCVKLQVHGFQASTLCRVGSKVTGAVWDNAGAMWDAWLVQLISLRHACMVSFHCLWVFKGASFSAFHVASCYD